MTFDAQVTFVRTADLELSTRFYADTLGLDLVLEQSGCRIFHACDGAYLGVCSHMGPPSPEGVVLTLVTDDVDGWFNRLVQRGIAFEKEPATNDKFLIYHCFFRDPDGHLLEIQRFDDPRWETNRCAESETG
jgi:catechol 2,3-dioxygenase-like lactoylglutathione lyase family enzyme